ncbi:hypothetical protein S83_035600 [Arachis hypogaea]|uniref:homogentisate 1,2-dioxygenase n=1 Tax=Arachis hypogaea TaxID=3818 RepID=A0A445ATI0_ARAHY|nr:hypothetical protein Ahy_B01g054201 [Arachis hypogaea]
MISQDKILMLTTEHLNYHVNKLTVMYKDQLICCFVFFFVFFLSANGLASPRNFLEDKFNHGYTIVQNFGGELFAAVLDFSPFDVVAWHGNYVSYKYDLNKFYPYNTVLLDHSDPSIKTGRCCDHEVNEYGCLQIFYFLVQNIA